jgi:hypothetical protein
VQKVREAANRSKCQNNLKQIGLAAHNYHSANATFGPGLDIQGVGPLVRLLPYLEQDAQFRIFQFRTPTYVTYYQDPLNRPATTGSTSVPRPPDRYGTEGEFPVFQCPTNPFGPGETLGVWLLNVYGPPADNPPTAGFPVNSVRSGNPGAVVMGKSHYMANAGDWRNILVEDSNPQVGTDCHGPYGTIKPVALEGFADGSSNTILFAETAGGWDDSAAGGAGWSNESWSHARWYSAFGSCPNGANMNCNNNPEGQGKSWGVAGSFHPNGAFNVAFSDGSIRTLRSDLPFLTLSYLAGYKDGVKIKPYD